MKYGFDFDDIKNEVIEICKKDYGPSTNGRTYVVKNTTESSVRHNIIKQFSDKEMRKMKYLNIVAYILGVKNDVIIDIDM